MLSTMRFLVLLLIAAGAGGAQQRAEPKSIDQDPIIGIRAPRTDRDWFADTTVKRRCPTFVLTEPVPPDSEHEGKPERSWCDVDRTYALPNADGTRWLGAVYSRKTVYAADSVRRELLNVALDTMVTVTAVLYSGRDHALPWTPSWVGSVARSMIISIDAESAPRPDRSMLAAVRYCFNGTGGCWQRYLRRVNAKWTSVTEAFWKELPPIDDGSVGKGLGIDISKLTGSYGLYSRGDGNCCPSRELHLVLDQRGDSLVLKSHQIKRVPPP
jgi:hypothetical protein